MSFQAQILISRAFDIHSYSKVKLDIFSFSSFFLSRRKRKPFVSTQRTHQKKKKEKGRKIQSTRTFQNSIRYSQKISHRVLIRFIVNSWKCKFQSRLCVQLEIGWMPPFENVATMAALTPRTESSFERTMLS